MTRGPQRPTFRVLRRFGALAVIALIVLAGTVAFGSRSPQVNAAGSIGAGWQNYDLIVSPGDWGGTASGAPDIIARRAERNS